MGTVGWACPGKKWGVSFYGHPRLGGKGVSVCERGGVVL